MKAILMVLLAVACTRMERVAEGGESEIAMKPMAAAMSKAVTGPVTGTYPQDETMGIFAYYNDGEPGQPWAEDEGENPYFPKMEFIFKDQVQAWGGVTASYWPLQGSIVFAGYSPFRRPKTIKDGDAVVTTEEDVAMDYDFLTKTLSLEDYTVCQYVPMTQEEIQQAAPYVNRYQSDLMFFLPQLDEDGRYVGVNKLQSNNVQFRHALSLIEFTVAAEDLVAINRVDLSKITVEGVFHRGDFEATAKADGEVGVTWKTDDAAAYDVDVFHSADPNLGLELFLTPRTIAQILIIPGVTHDIEIIYHVMVDEIHYEQRAVFTPEDLNLYEWKAGQKYVYDIVLGVDQMTFSPETQIWE